MPLAVSNRILNVSFYRFVALRDLEALRDEIKSRAIEAGLKGSILLSEEGINGFLAGPENILRPYLAWLYSKPPFVGIEPKESFSVDVPFSRMLVKIKKEIISMGRPEIRPAEFTGKRIYPKELKSWYDSEKDFVIVDTRNDYEIAEGTFKNAVHYDVETFRQFPEKLEQEAKALADKTVVMFCTGGIRCEKATALAMNLGIKDVYQLEGGILKYFEEVGQAHYRGDCFVFDHRTNLDAGLEARGDRKLREKLEGLRLYFDPKSPESLRVLFALSAKGVRCETISTTPETFPESLLKANPQKRLPVLVHSKKGQDDLALYDAAIILNYLDENYPELKSLLPESAERRARMRLWMDWIDHSFAEDADRWIQSRSKLSPEERYALEARLEKHLYRLKTPLQRSRHYLVVDAPTQADIAAYSVLRPLRNAGFPTEYPERFEPVWNWSENLDQLLEA